MSEPPAPEPRPGDAGAEAEAVQHVRSPEGWVQINKAPPASSPPGFPIQLVLDWTVEADHDLVRDDDDDDDESSLGLHGHFTLYRVADWAAPGTWLPLARADPAGLDDYSGPQTAATSRFSPGFFADGQPLKSFRIHFARLLIRRPGRYRLRFWCSVRGVCLDAELWSEAFDVCPGAARPTKSINEVQLDREKKGERKRQYEKRDAHVDHA
ncbi:hypothetical protein P8C59_000495 [Phyllachora maydis]|uniref:Velvet domain-containing protein n=1 Tax=Phyllachora maydis TaxID=1825666 RepID=A0AAD9M6I2_9PEZI|nr:hypothetical protein P8C59_000495 [Phyllachora maydis]